MVSPRAWLGGVLLLALSFSRCGARAGQWEAGQGFRSCKVQPPATGQVGFTSLPGAVTGIQFTNLLAAQRGRTNQILFNGSGVAAGDVDGDGWCDLFFCNLDGPCALFRNLGGWHFTNITAEAGVLCAGRQNTSAVFADVDGDGDLDLLVGSVGHGVRLFLNDGKGHFTENTLQAGLASTSGAMGLALGDVDGNGTLDLYVANYRTDTFQDSPAMRFRVSRVNGKPVIQAIDDKPVSSPELAGRYYIGEGNRVIENGEADVLYLNDGRGHFSAVSWTNGAFLDEDGHPLAVALLDWGLSVMLRDLNGDGAPDIYVCNDTHSPDRIWINDGHGRFRALPRLALRQTSFSSMGVDAADLNRDGLDEIFVTDMLARARTNLQTQMIVPRQAGPPGTIENRPDYQMNTLFLNRGDGTYAEIARFAGVEATDWTWGPVFLDVDLDGYEDLLISTGQEWNLLHLDTRLRIERARTQRRLSREEFFEMRNAYGRFDCPNYAFRNRGDLTFEDASAAWGFNSSQVSQGMCLADLDNDGDLDVVINCFRQPALVYRNETSAPRLAVRLKGKAPNTRGLGAKIKVLGGPAPQSQEIAAGGRYLSSDDPARTFACGRAASLVIEVAWRSGLRSLISNAPPNCRYEIDEAGAVAARPVASPPQAAPLFQDVSGLLQHVHHEEPFDDFARQPLLSRRLSQLGPGASWFDLDGDGWDDLIIASGKGGPLAVFRNDGKGGFAPRVGAAFTQPVPRDQTTVLGARTANGKTVLVAGSANYEDGSAEGSVARVYDLENMAIRDELPGQASSTGPLAMADVNGDGALDLLVGGRVVPGHYPEAASSLLFLGKEGGFVADAENTKALAGVGMVSGAVFTDLDGDGWPDLVLACDWGPLRVFHNVKGRLASWDWKLVGPAGAKGSPAFPRLNAMTGWWTGVAAGDFDGDGRMDLIACNWGRNTSYQRYLGRPIRIFHGDLNQDGATECVEACFDPSLQKVVPWQRWNRLATALPFLQTWIQGYDDFSARSVEEVFREHFPRFKQLEAGRLETVVLLNRGDGFELGRLPAEAQLAPAFAACVADFDGDGHEDVFLSQNFFGTDWETARYDAGRGLLLRGDGRGGFAADSGPASGLLVYGEQRGAAAGDYDADGRTDLVVTQNGAQTRLFHNTGARPGLRVRLQGLPANPQGIGAVLRLGDGAGRLGPAREIHAGSGYWSQDSAVQVMRAEFEPKEIWIRWPGGQVTTSALPAGAHEVVVGPSGAARPPGKG